MRNEILPQIYAWMLDESLMFILFTFICLGIYSLYDNYFRIKYQEDIPIAERYYRLLLIRRYGNAVNEDGERFNRRK